MPVREVLQLGDPRLRSPAEPVDDPRSPEIAALVSDLADTLGHWRETTTYGRGIAATQIGSRHRVLYLEVDGPWPMVDPVVTGRSDETVVLWDACLSFLTVFFQARRHEWIDVTYRDLSGAEHTTRATGELSELLQHEIDHLDGVLALDRMTDVKTMCTREQFELRHRAESPYALC